MIPLTAIAAALTLLCSAARIEAQESLVPASAVESKGVEQSRSTLACGPCAMSFVVELLGVRASNEELAGMADPTGSTSFADLARFARRKGLFADAFTMTPTQLFGLERVAILQVVVRSDPSEPWTEHFVTWAGPGRTSSTGVVFDPVTSSGRGEVPMNILIAKWTGAALVISDDPIDVTEITGKSAWWPGLLRSGGIGAFAGSLAVAGVIAVRSRRGRCVIA